MKKDFILQKKAGIWLGFSPMLLGQDIKHTFTTKLYGESAVIPGSLNMSLHVNDNEQYIIHNRKKVCEALQIDFADLTTPKQVHGDNIVYVDSSLKGKGRLIFAEAIDGADALFTDLPGIPLMLLFADCTPVIISDPVKKVVAVVHAGWRSTVQKIVQKTVARMQSQLGVQPENCFAVVGPSMGPCCYQVGTEVYHAARKNLADFEQLFVQQSESQWLFDLWQANASQLMEAGLQAEKIAVSGVCTQCDRALFFSHRADQGKTGRFAALAWLEK